MISKIEIENFQSHKNTTLELSNGVNIIKGASHSGKSSVMRAIKWVLFNRPSGTPFKSFFSSDKEDTSVKIYFNDNSYVHHVRGKTHYYQINDCLLTALGTDVPDEVLNILNMNEINFLSQHEGYYLLQDSSGSVAKLLNKLVGIDIIDLCLERTNKKINSINSELKDINEKIESCTIELDTYVDLEEKDSKLRHLESVVNDISDKKRTSYSLNEIIKRVCITKTALQNTIEYLEGEYLVNEIKIVLNKLTDASNNQKNLKKLCCDITKISKDVVNLEQKVKPIRKIIELKDIAEECVNLSTEHNKLNRKVEDIRKNYSLLAVGEKLTDDLMDKHKTFLSEQKICPLCKQEIRI